MSDDQVCYTFDAAVEMAIKMEDEGFRHYLAAIRSVSNKGAREILRENALDELNHKHQLEKALLDGRMAGGEELDKPIPTMHLEYILKNKRLLVLSTKRHQYHQHFPKHIYHAQDELHNLFVRLVKNHLCLISTLPPLDT